MKPVNLIMFDYDGVIVDSLQVFCMNYIAACQENGLSEIETEKDVLALFEHNVYATLLQRGVMAQTIDKILKDYERRQSEYLLELKLFDSMGDALNEISKNNKIFIITSNVSIATESVMQRHGINCFEEVIGAEKEKSKIRKIEMVMARFKELPAFYVGDTKGDMIEGKAAGTKTVGVAWGWHGIEKLKEGGADFIVQSPQELVSLFLK
ncbi:HAD family hydrolase [Sporomusa malonica]|uniref:Phosphoglycolate phosphatase n=1 Tax=Sporomusa malonica TaxID=112901 RepID=A0A1W2EXK4_9FIRM|nr:HAD family hydrolase [Sporomusa malonica]SMD13918.1 phosphoglycolate phosphatase [Sporomusa malonica]